MVPWPWRPPYWIVRVDKLPRLVSISTNRGKMDVFKDFDWQFQSNMHWKRSNIFIIKKNYFKSVSNRTLRSYCSEAELGKPCLTRWKPGWTENLTYLTITCGIFWTYKSVLKKTPGFIDQTMFTKLCSDGKDESLMGRSRNETCLKYIFLSYANCPTQKRADHFNCDKKEYFCESDLKNVIHGRVSL